MAIKSPFVFEIAYRTWCIDEFGLDNLFLLEDRDKTLLIDTGDACNPNILLASREKA